VQRKIESEEMKAAAYGAYWIELVFPSEIADQPPAELSGGQSKGRAIAAR